MLFLNILSFVNLINDKNIDKNIFFNQINPSQQNLFLISNDSDTNKIGIVDFRYILKKSNAIKILGNKFLTFQKKSS